MQLTAHANGRHGFVLNETDFQIVENLNNPEQGSRAYTNPWIAENRYNGHAALTDAQGNPLPWPPTNMVLIASRPVA